MAWISGRLRPAKLQAPMAITVSPGAIPACAAGLESKTWVTSMPWPGSARYSTPIPCLQPTWGISSEDSRVLPGCPCWAFRYSSIPLTAARVIASESNSPIQWDSMASAARETSSRSTGSAAQAERTHNSSAAVDAMGLRKCRGKGRRRRDALAAGWAWAAVVVVRPPPVGTEATLEGPSPWPGEPFALPVG